MPEFGINDTSYSATNTREFHELQFAAMVEFNKLINGYQAIRRHMGGDRLDHVLTQQRKELLLGLKAVDREGNIYYDKMLEMARTAIKAFDREDIQR